MLPFLFISFIYIFIHILDNVSLLWDSIFSYLAGFLSFILSLQDSFRRLPSGCFVLSFLGPVSFNGDEEIVLLLRTFCKRIFNGTGMVTVK